MLSALAVLAVALTVQTAAGQRPGKFLHYSTDDACQLQLVESIPEKLTYNSTIQHLRTYDAYSWLVTKATKNVNFASLYWSLRGADVLPSGTPLAEQGERLYKQITNAGRSLKMRIAYNRGGLRTNMSDLTELSRLAKVSAVGLNFTALFGTGVLHTKTVSTDSRHAYIGSSNMDWRSLTQIKELGIMLTNCPTLVSDLDKIFQIYYLTGEAGRVPNPWPKSVIGSINATNPWKAKIGDYKYSIYLGASPQEMCPPYRSRDIDAILATVKSARQFVHIAVMDYEAKLRNYATRQSSFWPEIDNALRDAAFRGVRVRVLASHWQHSDPDVRRFLLSLAALNSSRVRVEGKLFVVPTYTKEQARIPFARVNHNKYLVTEATAVICTSNWEGSYFSSTAGVAMVITQLDNALLAKRFGNGQRSIVNQVQDIFERDWYSSYAQDLS